MNVFFIKKIKQKIYQLTKETVKELVIIGSCRPTQPEGIFCSN